MQCYGFLSFAKNIGTHATKVAKNMSNKYSQNLLDSVKKSTTDAIETTSKRAIQKTADATGDLIGQKKKKKCYLNNKYFKVTKGISLKGIPFTKSFKRFSFKNRW